MRAEPSDRQLLARCRDGDTDAFRELFDRKHRRVWRIAYQIVGDAAVAEEVAQEVFLALWRHCDRYRPRFAVDTWLDRIATNRAIDAWRAARSRPETPASALSGAQRNEPAEEALGRRGATSATRRDDAAGGGAPARGPATAAPPAPPDALARYHELQAIWDELAELLPPQQRAAFVLREIEGLPTAEVAAALEVSASTVRSHIAAARATLRRALEERYPELLH